MTKQKLSKEAEEAKEIVLQLKDKKDSLASSIAGKERSLAYHKKMVERLTAELPRDRAMLTMYETGLPFAEEKFQKALKEAPIQAKKEALEAQIAKLALQLKSLR